MKVFSEQSLVSHHKPHSLVGQLDVDEERVIVDGTHKNMEVSSQVNLQMKEDDLQMTASASVNPNAIQVDTGYVEVDVPKTLNSVSSTLLAFTITNNSATVRTAQAITLTPYLATTGGAATPDSSNFTIVTQYAGATAPLAFNATAATIQTALRGLGSRYASVTVTGTIETAVVITLVGIDASNATHEIWGQSAGLNDGGVSCVIATIISVAFAYGDECKLVPAPILIETVETRIGSTQLDIITGDHIWENIKTFLTKEDRARVAAVCGFNVDTNLSNNIIIPGQAITYYVPLIGLALSSREIPIKNLSMNTKITLKIKFKYGAKLLESGTVAATGINYYPSTGLITDLTVTNAEIIGIGELWKTQENNNQRNELLGLTHDYRYLRNAHATIASKAYVAGIQRREKIGLSGNISHMYICPRLTSGIGSSIYTNQELQYFEVEDGGGTSISGAYSKPSDYNRYIESMVKFSSDSFTLDPLYYWSPCKDPVRVTYTGEQLGNYLMKNVEHLKFTTNYTGDITFDLYVCYYHWLKNTPSGQHIVSSE